MSSLCGICVFLLLLIVCDLNLTAELNGGEEDMKNTSAQTACHNVTKMYSGEYVDQQSILFCGFMLFENCYC